MSLYNRSVIVGALFICALFLYGTAKHYSPSLIFHVVEQSLFQKAPSGTDPARIRTQLRALLDTDADQSNRMNKLLRISMYLEKVQHLTPEDLSRLLASDDF